MIAKKDLINNQDYIGACRNAFVAKWIKEKEMFCYIRTKFGSTFLEWIRHPEDDDGFDLFIPYKKSPVMGDEEWIWSLELAGTLIKKRENMDK